MKHLLTAALLAFGFFTCEEPTTEADVPQAVLSAFNASYPGATDVEWEMEGDAYEVEFDFSGEEYEIEYSATGQVLDMDED